MVEIVRNFQYANTSLANSDHASQHSKDIGTLVLSIVSAANLPVVIVGSHADDDAFTTNSFLDDYLSIRKGPSQGLPTKSNPIRKKTRLYMRQKSRLQPRNPCLFLQQMQLQT